MQVPLLITGKHPSLKAGTVRDELVSLLDVSATTLALAEADLPEYLEGQDLFAKEYTQQKYVIGARDRCDYTIDRIRTVRSDKYRYIRNYYPDRPMMQAGYRDDWPMVEDMRKLFNEGKLSEYQTAHWFEDRPIEELYDLGEDPHQMNNLAADINYEDLLVAHRNVLENWINETDDQGQYKESATQLKATYDLWKDLPIFKDTKVNPEYDQFQ